jgi:hypothetical protein
MCLSCHNTIYEISLVMGVLHPTRNALGLTKTGWRAFRRSVAIALCEMREPVRTAQQILGHAFALDPESMKNSISAQAMQCNDLAPKKNRARFLQARAASFLVSAP